MCVRHFSLMQFFRDVQFAMADVCQPGGILDFATLLIPGTAPHVRW